MKDTMNIEKLVAGRTMGLFGRYWIGTVNGAVKCSHMHQTPKAALRCAQRWIDFQKKVARFKSRASVGC